MDNERFEHPQLEDRPLVYIEKVIEKAFEGDPASWKDMEPEVILEKLKEKGHEVTLRLMAKVKLIKYFQDNEINDLLEDPLRVLYAAEVINNEDSVFADPDYIPSLTSLELAYFVTQIESLGGLSRPENAPYEFKKVCSYVLSEEGFHEPPFPFTFLSKEDLYPVYMRDELPETDKKIQSSRQQGIDKYLQLMGRLGA